MKKVLVIILTLSLIGALAGCGKSPSSETAVNPGASGDYTYKVGVINVSDADENCYLAFKTFKDILEAPEFSKKVGHDIKVEWTSSDLDVTKQMSNAETLIAKKVDAILMIGCDNDSSASVVEASNKAGIPIFMVVSEAVSGEYKFIGFNEYDCGYHQGKYVVDNAEEGAKVCILEGVEGRSATIERGQGITEALAERPDIEILAMQTGEFTAEKAMQVTEDWIQAYGNDIDWIITEDNKMGQGAVEVLKAADMVDDVKVNSWIVSGTWDADLMKDGYVEYAVFVSFKVLGETMADVMEKFYTSDSVEERTYMNLYDVTNENFSEFFK